MDHDDSIKQPDGVAVLIGGPKDGQHLPMTSRGCPPSMLGMEGPVDGYGLLRVPGTNPVTGAAEERWFAGHVSLPLQEITSRAQQRWAEALIVSPADQ